MKRLTNVLSFDVEDWQQSTLDRSLPVTSRVQDNTLRVLDLLASAGVRGTFFVLGLVAEAFPDLIRRIVGGGHEVACHGHAHGPVHAMTPGEFRADLKRSVSLIEQAAGEKVVGYRAPDFSITTDSFWAFEVLAEEGFLYDSSIFPFAGPRYGVGKAFTVPYHIRCRANPALVEFPLTTMEFLGLRIPAAGGGYFRLFPYSHTRLAIARLNGRGSPATAYFHPYEIDTEEFARLEHSIPLSLRLSQGTGRARVASKMARLLKEFAWVPARDLLSDAHTLTGGRLLDLSDTAGRGARWISEGTQT